MKKNRFLIMLLTVTLYLSFAVPSAMARDKQRYLRHQKNREVRKVRIVSTNKNIRRLSTKHLRNQRQCEPRRVLVPATYKKVRRYSQGYRPQGRWVLRKVWVPPTPNYKRVMVPGYYSSFGRAMIGNWVRIADRPGYWINTWVWVSY